MEHIFQYECSTNHPSGCSFDLLWLRKLENAMVKDLESLEALIGILFMEIVELG